MANSYDVSIMRWQPDAVEPQFHESFPSAQRSIKLAASTSYPKGTWLGPVTASPGTFGVYAHANVDGTQVPQCLLARDYYTDANGNIYEGQQASEEEPGISHQSVPAYFGGCFRQADMAANALSTQMLTDLRTYKPGAYVLYGSIAGNNAFLVF